jgi:hypothetical protein
MEAVVSSSLQLALPMRKEPQYQVYMVEKRKIPAPTWDQIWVIQLVTLLTELFKMSIRYIS